MWKTEKISKQTKLSNLKLQLFNFYLKSLHFKYKLIDTNLN